MTGVPEGIGPLYPLVVDGVSIESEVRRRTAPQRSLASEQRQGKRRRWACNRPRDPLGLGFRAGLFGGWRTRSYRGCCDEEPRRP